MPAKARSNAPLQMSLRCTTSALCVIAMTAPRACAAQPAPRSAVGAAMTVGLTLAATWAGRADNKTEASYATLLPALEDTQREVKRLSDRVDLLQTLVIAFSKNGNGPMVPVPAPAPVLRPLPRTPDATPPPPPSAPSSKPELVPLPMLKTKLLERLGAIPTHEY